MNQEESDDEQKIDEPKMIKPTKEMFREEVRRFLLT